MPNNPDRAVLDQAERRRRSDDPASGARPGTTTAARHPEPSPEHRRPCRTVRCNPVRTRDSGEPHGPEPHGQQGQDRGRLPNDGAAHTAIEEPAVWRCPTEEPDRAQRRPRRVAVIGAGTVGLATAWFLQQRGVVVDVFERRGVAAGSSRAAPGGSLPP